jgi:hypothetical protein
MAAATARQRDATTDPTAPLEGRTSPVNSPLFVLVPAGSPRCATCSLPTVSRPVSTASPSDGAAPCSPPVVCSSADTESVVFRRWSTQCCGYWWSVIQCHLRCCPGSSPEPGRRRPCSHDVTCHSRPRAAHSPFKATDAEVRVCARRRHIIASRRGDHAARLHWLMSSSSFARARPARAISSAMAGAAARRPGASFLPHPLRTHTDTHPWPRPLFLLRLPHNRFLDHSRHFVLHR